MVTNGSEKFGMINGVAILTGRVKFHDLRAVITKYSIHEIRTTFNKQTNVDIAYSNCKNYLKHSFGKLL